MEPFSVLLPVYHSDQAEFLARSLRSVIGEQVRPPNELVVVRDGPIPDAVAQVILQAEASSPVPVTIVELAENQGLGRALDAGLRACTHEIIARQDADDISLPQRFETLVPIVEAGVDLVGSGLLEFDSAEDQPIGRRTPPTDPARIVRYARFQDPFNHPTVVYRRSAVEAVGGYEDLPLLEDYWLFVRMLNSGARVANVAEPLVLYRVGAGAYARRGGLDLLRSEVDLQRRMRHVGYTSRTEYVRNVVTRGGYRIVPQALRKAAYRGLLGHWTHPSSAS